MRRRVFCTYFDTNYLPFALALHVSLTRNCEGAHLIMVCMDEHCYTYLERMKISNITLHRIKDLESQVPGLAACRDDRTMVEYYYTCSASICYHILYFFSGVDELTYLDADLYFFNDPEPIFHEMEGKSIGIIPHNFSMLSRHSIRYGKFNVGWITFRNDNNARQCVKDWKDHCIEWCYQKVEGHRYADQKYLDHWENRYKGVHVIQNKGANLGLWNVANYRLVNKNNIVLVDETPLVFYHFSSFKQNGPREFKTGTSRALVRLEGVLRDDIYTPYARAILSFAKSDYRIKAKDDIHVTGITAIMRVWTNKIREFFYPDVLKI